MISKQICRWGKAVALFAAGGALFQTAGCDQGLNELAAGAVAGLATSIVNTFLTLWLGQWFGTGGFGF